MFRLLPAIIKSTIGRIDVTQLFITVSKVTGFTIFAGSLLPIVANLCLLVILYIVITVCEATVFTKCAGSLLPFGANLCLRVIMCLLDILYIVITVGEGAAFTFGAVSFQVETAKILLVSVVVNIGV